MASWREDGKTRNVHLGSARKMDGEAASQKAREMKAEGLHNPILNMRGSGEERVAVDLIRPSNHKIP